MPELDRVVKRLAEGRGISEKTLLDEMQRVKEVEAEACDIRVNRILTDRR